MPGKIFVSYRRDDDRSTAARVRDRLAASFGDANVFMDVDKLIAGQRFDTELEKALSQTDVFLAVIGPRWEELLADRQASSERDYVREEIAGALQRGIVVIPVLIERTPLPRAEALPDDIRDLVFHHKHVVTHERFGRDVAGLVEAIRFARKAARGEAGGEGWVGAVVLAALVLASGLLAYQMVASDRGAEAKRQEERAKADAEKAKQEERKRLEAERRRLALLKAEQNRARELATVAAQANRIAEEMKHLQKAEGDLLRPGRVFRDCPDVCPEMVVVPAGSFMMGSSPAEIEDKQLPWTVRDEGPQGAVTIARPFAVGKFEVTFTEWEACVSDGGCTSNTRPSDNGWGRGRRPVINGSWHHAKDYAAWLSRKTGKSYRLLSEAEWEYAARAGTTTRYAYGDTISKSQAQYWEGKWYSPKTTAEVGSFPANGFGLHDLHGNVSEWVEDAWHPNYLGAPRDGSVWRGGDTSRRVVRGGSRQYLTLEYLRSANRDWNEPVNGNFAIGFRLSRAL
jgi:formylglycine-generating enzyme required for sulfatase activity